MLAAVYGLTLEEGYKAAGLTLCEVCGKAGTDYQWYPFCGKKHWKEVNEPVYLWLICDHCGKGFWRFRTLVLRYQGSRDYSPRFIVCSRECHGKYVAARWGFKAISPDRTVCAHGHPWTPENTYYRGRLKTKQCRICNRQRLRNRRQPLAFGGSGG